MVYVLLTANIFVASAQVMIMLAWVVQPAVIDLKLEPINLVFAMNITMMMVLIAQHAKCVIPYAWIAQQLLLIAQPVMQIWIELGIQLLWNVPAVKDTMKTLKQQHAANVIFHASLAHLVAIIISVILAEQVIIENNRRV